MSFEVFVQFFDCGESAGVARSAIRALFPVAESESEPDYWSVRYDDLNSCHIRVTPLASDTGVVGSLCVFRPCKEIQLWDALFALMRQGHGVLYFPGDAPPLVANEFSRGHIPPDMVEAMGQPRAVQSGQEIVEVIEYA